MEVAAVPHHESTCGSVLPSLIVVCWGHMSKVSVTINVIKQTFNNGPNEDESNIINPLNAELNPICCLLALLAHHFLHVSRIRVKSLTLRLLKSYIYVAPILDVSRSHTTMHHSR